MQINDKIFDYLKSKLKTFEKTTKNGAVLFTCPNIAKHKFIGKSPTATIISGSDKISCLQCSWRGTFFDAVRVLEADKTNQSDAQITEYLINSLKVDMYSELDIYQNRKWSLVPLLKNDKKPIEKDWTNITHYEKVDWIKWLNNGLNIGLRTGKESGITVIDYDTKPNATPEEKVAREKLATLLVAANTLMQNSARGGVHYIFSYDKDIPQTVNIADLKIDTRNDGGQIVIQPSKFNNLPYIWKNINAEVKPLPEEIKVKLLELMKVEVSKKKTSAEEIQKVSDGPIELIHNNLEGCCNDTFTKLGGILINKFSPEQVEFILSLMNRNLLKNPMPTQSIQAMIGSLDKYKSAEDSTQEKSIYEYLKMLQNDVNAKDIMDSLKLPRAIVDKYLSQFVKDGKAIRLSRGRYKFREKVEWTDKWGTAGTSLKYKVPYFDFLQDFEEGDIILLGAKPGTGKTTTSMNIISQLVKQGIKPYYIYSESGSRYQKTAIKLGIKEEQFYKAYHGNPLSIEIEPNAFTVLDWLLVSEKENTDTIFKFFTEEMSRKGGLLVILMQLKENYEFYAPNMVVQMPALAAKYIMDAEDGSRGHWEIVKLRDPRGNYRNYVIPCTYNFETKELKADNGV
jgi:DNA replication protein DnaC